MPQLKTTALYLRSDGTLLVAQGEVGIELQLSPSQLVQLGIDALRVAVTLDPHQAPAVLHALDHTYVMPPEVPACLQQH